jgi:hypothetical protein
MVTAVVSVAMATLSVVTLGPAVGALIGRVARGNGLLGGVAGGIVHGCIFSGCWIVIGVETNAQAEPALPFDYLGAMTITATFLVMFGLLGLVIGAVIDGVGQLWRTNPIV